MLWPNYVQLVFFKKYLKTLDFREKIKDENKNAIQLKSASLGRAHGSLKYASTLSTTGTSHYKIKKISFKHSSLLIIK